MRLPIGAVLVAALLGAGVALTPADAGWAKPTPNPTEKAAATVAPAVLYLEVRWHGEIRDRTTGTLYDPAMIDLTTRCSGFAVSTDGFLVTAGHCVDPGPEGITPAFFGALADRFEQTNRLAPADRATFLATLASKADIEGNGLGQPPERVVTVQRGDVSPGRTSGADVFTAQVVDVHSRSAGDVALLKADRTNQPVAALAGVQAPATGTDVVALGYPMNAQSGPTLSATVEDGQLSGPSSADGVPFYEVAAPTSEGMDGGPVVNLDGAVLGLLSHAPGGTSGPPTALSPVSLITDELAKNKVHNDLGKIDKDYRDGLNDYYDGRYTEAIAKFDSVLAMAPSHIQAQQYQQKAVSLRETEGEPLDPHVVLYATVGGGVLLLILIVLITVLIVRGRRRRKARRLAAANPAPAPVTPVAGASASTARGVSAPGADPAVATAPARSVPPPVPPAPGAPPPGGPMARTHGSGNPAPGPSTTGSLAFGAPASGGLTSAAGPVPPVEPLATAPARPPAPAMPAPPVFSAPVETADPLPPVPAQASRPAPTFSEPDRPAVPVSEPALVAEPVFAEPVFVEPVFAEPAFIVPLVEPAEAVAAPTTVEPVEVEPAVPAPEPVSGAEPVLRPEAVPRPETVPEPAAAPVPEPEPAVPSKWDLDLPPLAPGAPAAPVAVIAPEPPPPPAPTASRRPLPPPSLLYCSNCSNASPAGTAVCPTCGQTFA